MLERRDTALLVMGFTGAFRRSELVGLTCGDVTVHRLDGLHIALRRSKTGQEGRGDDPCTAARRLTPTARRVHTCAGHTSCLRSTAAVGPR